MHSELMLDGRSIGRVQVLGVSGANALGAARLHINLEVDLRQVFWEGDQAVLFLWGDCAIEISGKGPSLVGTLDFTRPLEVLRESGAPAQRAAQAILPLTRSQLDSIEERRGGGALALHPSFNAAHIDSPRASVLYANNLRYDVSQSDWLRLLESMGYQETMLLEIRLPDISYPSDLAPVTGAMKAAQELLARGEYRDSVAKCRVALELLARSLGGVPEEDPVMQTLLEGIRRKDKGERLEVVRRALKALTDPASHGTADSRNIEWTRTDATSVITMLSAILRQAAQ